MKPFPLDLVIIGNGVAGITAALELARRKAGGVDVFTSEPYHYYYRPRLPSFIAGELSEKELFAHEPSWYENAGIKIHLSTPVVRLFPERKAIVTAYGREYSYRKLLLATGSRPLLPLLEGIDKEGVFALRTLDDARAIKSYSEQCERAVILGGGLLGLEAARALRVRGLSVVVLERAPYLLPRQLDEEGARVLRRLVESMGIKVEVSAEARAILGNGKVESVVLRDGRKFQAQLVLVTIGVRCNAELAREAGLLVEGGIVVDERMATSAPDVYAAGDVAYFRGRSWGIIPVALAQAQVAASSIAGEETIYREVVPSNSLKIMDIEVASVGEVNLPENQGIHLRLSRPEAGIYRKIVLRDGIALGCISIGDRKWGAMMEKLIKDKAPIALEEALKLLEGGA